MYIYIGEQHVLKGMVTMFSMYIYMYSNTFIETKYMIVHIIYVSYSIIRIIEATNLLK